MNIFRILVFSVLSLLCLTGCFPDDFTEDIKTEQEPVVKPKPEPDPAPEPELPAVPSYDNLEAYDYLKNYVDRTRYPNFKVGAAIPVSDFLKMSQRYDMAVNNLDEMTAENAMKPYIQRPDIKNDFSKVEAFLDEAQKAGISVFGHTLAWHSQHTPYLYEVVKGRKVEVSSSEAGPQVLFEADFQDGDIPFMYWGNDSSADNVDGTFMISNPSKVEGWQVQFAFDVSEPFIPGHIYQLTLRIKGSAEGAIGACLQNFNDNYVSVGDFADIGFDTQWREVDVTAECILEGGLRVIFNVGEFVGDIYIDDFKFIDTNCIYAYEPYTEQERKEAVAAEMDRWIKSIMEVTATRVSVWDAVNEPISDSDSDGDGIHELHRGWGGTSTFFWQDYLGDIDYVRIVIEKARKYYAEFGGKEPLRLFINDYCLEAYWDDNVKLRSLIHWINLWESDGVTVIDGIGSQMHTSYSENPESQKSREEHYVKMLQLMVETGKLVRISELDLGYEDRNGKTLMASELTDDQHRAMADYYEFIVRKYLEIVPPAQQYGIAHWAPVDPPEDSWRGGEPVGLWDVNYNRKYSYAGFANGLMAY